VASAYSFAATASVALEINIPVANYHRDLTWGPTEVARLAVLLCLMDIETLSHSTVRPSAYNNKTE
jgi:hypothetical protein